MKVTTFLMFTGQAEKAMALYTSVFPGSRIESMDRYGAEEPGREGTVKRAILDLYGTRLMCVDSPPVHAFSFTPSISLFVDCDSEAGLDQAFGRLGEEGQVLMPAGDYGFSRRFAWVQDRFGVSWQLNLP